MEREEVLRLTAAFFENNRKERKMKSIEGKSRWREAYKPKNIKKGTYAGLMREIDQSELMEALKSRKNGSAGGRSGISYEWFKRMGPDPSNNLGVY